MSAPTLLGITRPPEWMAAGLCTQVDPELFWPESGHDSRDARAVCGRCPVRVECLDYAFTNRERYGVWGGMSERQRRTLRETGGRPRRPDERVDVVRLLAATLSDSQIAVQLGCSRRTVRDIRASAGIPPARARRGGTTGRAGAA